jgi:hypothetical protein
MSLVPLPPRDLASIPLRTVELLPARLLRISRFGSGEPFFGRAAANRFDDPGRVKSRRFGTCYLGCSLEVAIAETVLHDELPEAGGFSVAVTEIESRWLVRFKGGNALKLADLTGAALKTLVGSGGISTIMPYDVPQRWAAALHAHPDAVDGLVYMSRHVNDERAVVVFDRAAARLGTPRYQPLAEARGALKALMNLRINARFA